MEVAPTHKLLTLLYSIISIAIWQERHNYMALWALEQKEGRVMGPTYSTAMTTRAPAVLMNSAVIVSAQ